MLIIVYIVLVSRGLKPLKQFVHFGKDLDELGDNIKIYLRIYLMKLSLNFQDRTL